MKIVAHFVLITHVDASLTNPDPFLNLRGVSGAQLDLILL